MSDYHLPFTSRRPLDVKPLDYFNEPKNEFLSPFFKMVAIKDHIRFSQLYLGYILNLSA